MRACYTLLFLFLFGTIANLWGQSPEQKVSLHNFKLKTSQIDYKGRKGIELGFDLAFNWVDTDYKKKNFFLTWVIQDAEGKEVLRSAEQSTYTDQKKRVLARPAWREQNPKGMQRDDIQLALPLKFLPLKSGKQTFTAIFSLKNETYSFENFASETFTFEHEEIKEHPFSEQKFTVENWKFSQQQTGFGTDVPGLKMSFRLRPKYGQDVTASTSYGITWVLRDSTGKVVFDSRKTTSIHHRRKYVHFDRLTGGAFRKTVCFLSYDEIKLPGPGQVQIVLFAKSEAGETKEIYTGKHYLNLPVKYYYSEQKFKVSDLKSSISEVKGLHGLGINFNLSFEKVGPRMDPELGDYYIYAVIRDRKGNVVYAPKKLDIMKGQSSAPVFPCAAFLDKGPIKIEIFIPWYQLNLLEGKAYLQYSLFASSQSRAIKFPELGKGGRVVLAPRLRNYHFSLTNLEIVDGDYDVEFLKAGSHKPDLQWMLQLGRDNLYTSKQINNTLKAPKGEANITVAEGDKLSIVLYDIDSGILNRDDWINRWEIQYLPQKGDFVHEASAKGNLISMRVEMLRKP